MANKFSDTAKNVKDTLLDKNNASGALVDWGKRFAENTGAVAGKLFNGAKGAGGAASGVVGWGAEKAGTMASRANTMTAKALNNKYVGGALMIAAAVGIYKWAKGKLNNNRIQNDIDIKNQQAAKIEAQTEQMVKEYNNPHAKSGHVARYNAEKGAAQGVGVRQY